MTAASPAQRLFGRFGVDTRALAAVRVGLSAIVIVEWFVEGAPDGLAGLVEGARWVLLPLAVVHLVGVRTGVTSVLMWIASGAKLARRRPTARWPAIARRTSG